MFCVTRVLQSFMTGRDCMFITTECTWERLKRLNPSFSVLTVRSRVTVNEILTDTWSFIHGQKITFVTSVVYDWHTSQAWPLTNDFILERRCLNVKKEKRNFPRRFPSRTTREFTPGRDRLSVIGVLVPSRLPPIFLVIRSPTATSCAFSVNFVTCALLVLSR